jgi:hypothetical protein
MSLLNPDSAMFFAPLLIKGLGLGGTLRRLFGFIGIANNFELDGEGDPANPIVPSLI